MTKRLTPPAVRRCVVCAKRPPTGVAGMCRQCGRAFDVIRDGTEMSVIEWAAKRARWFERRRHTWVRRAYHELRRNR